MAYTGLDLEELAVESDVPVVASVQAVLCGPRPVSLGVVTADVRVHWGITTVGCLWAFLEDLEHLRGWWRGADTSGEWE